MMCQDYCWQSRDAVGAVFDVEQQSQRSELETVKAVGVLKKVSYNERFQLLKHPTKRSNISGEQVMIGC